MNWEKQPADITPVYELGSFYPVALVCTIWEENELGERRIYKSKTLKVVQEES